MRIFVFIASVFATLTAVAQAPQCQKFSAESVKGLIVIQSLVVPQVNSYSAWTRVTGALNVKCDEPFFLGDASVCGILVTNPQPMQNDCDGL